jgi:hypothetical protein
MSGADPDLVVRAWRAVVGGTLRPCSVGVRRTWLRGRPCPSPADGEPAGRLLGRAET